MADETPRMVTVTVFDAEDDSKDFPCGRWTGAPLVDVLGWFEDQLALVPKAYRRSARCRIEGDCDPHGIACTRISITYQRPQTKAEELAEREAEIARQRIAEEREKATLAALQAKYGAR